MAFDGRDEPLPNRLLTLALLLLLLCAIVAFFNIEYFASAYAGIVAFLVIPAAIGGLISHLFDPGGRQTPMGCFFWPTVGLLVIVTFAWAIFEEGAICIAMVLPIWIPAAIFGALMNRYNARRDRQHNNPARLNSVAWLSIPLLMVTWDATMPTHWQTRSVVREVVIDANREDIWPLLLRVPNISRGEGVANFTQDILGVPRPTHADLVARADRLVRIAHWGEDLSFEEAIIVKKPGELLSWQFVFPNKSVQYHTDNHISPNGPLLKIDSGRYELLALRNGRSLLRLTTEYEMRTRLGVYLGWWGERLLGDVQDNVLAVIKDRAEGRKANS
ncbi:MAG: hypothetical protein KKD64_09480 [Alphaproteobacteria bacterium]|nr:hypothetical protein [Alphaproteobacteria bacterium]MBU0792903.1 hypothetical protein [Alphaproteobacteria bacterium]MBU0874561.1 hypothetical protein [Alphaproteobacteria bacterium]MBU1769874.1 hypothetical protein [Alphaproteobacteria bacterium]